MPNQIFYTETIPCLVRDKEVILFQADIKAVTTKNDRGKLDVLPGHTHFISIIEDSIHIIAKDGKVVDFPVHKGILKVFDNEVKIYLGIFSSVSKSNPENESKPR